MKQMKKIFPVIQANCINCGACVLECVVNAVSQPVDKISGIHTINTTLCNQCEGKYYCVSLCPMNAIVLETI